VIELTPEQMRAVDCSPEYPARIANPTTGNIEVLLCSDDFDWIRGMLGDEAAAVHYRHSQTKKSYVILSEKHYERFKAFFEEDPLAPAEKKALLREAGRRAGWDEPAWDAGSSGEP
jgi:hypothetical protein